MMDELDRVSDMVNSDGKYTREQAIGLVSALLDGLVERFEYRGLHVFSKDGGHNIHVVDPDTGEGYGHMIAKGAPVLTTLDWIDAKAELYGETHD